MDKVERYINDYTRNCSNELCSVQDKYGKQIISYNEWLTPDNARRAVEIARGEMIEKAATWFANRYQVNGSYLNANDIDDFRKAME